MELLLDPSTYIDNDKLPAFVDLVEEFSKQDLSHLWFDVGEVHVGRSINWKSIAYDLHDKHFASKELEEKLAPIVEYAETIVGLKRVTINFLEGYSFMPIHVDGEGIPEYDTRNGSYNVVVPVTDHGQSIVDYVVVKNKKGCPLIFHGQVPHGAMNDTLQTRITLFLIVDKTRFIHDST
jgi:hypothetical protein